MPGCVEQPTSSTDQQASNDGVQEALPAHSCDGPALGNPREIQIQTVQKEAPKVAHMGSVSLALAEWIVVGGLPEGEKWP